MRFGFGGKGEVTEVTEESRVEIKDRRLKVNPIRGSPWVLFASHLEATRFFFLTVRSVVLLSLCIVV